MGGCAAHLGPYRGDHSLEPRGWHKLQADGSEEVYPFALADVDVEKNEVFDRKLRMKSAKDTQATRAALVVGNGRRRPRRPTA
ncbi:hypothetical protein ACF059_15475 [Streptomyces sp. NPDC016562]|uniref:hypothetical protein n=1 Tax=Streptomyces sp. NPDC016562 TaxID=3364966 RepID=UPI0037020CF0